MKLDADTKIEDLLRQYTFLIDFLPQLSPKYAKLKSPFIRRTMGAIATMGKVAKIGGMELGDLLYALAGEIERRTGDRVEVDVPGAAPRGVDEERKEALKSILRDLHAGRPIDELKAEFSDLIVDLAPGDLGAVEQSLIDEGLPESEIKDLCNLHVEVFKEGLDKGDVPTMPGGHPVHTMMMENRAAENIVAELDSAICDLGDPPDADAFTSRRDDVLQQLDSLSQLDMHYLKKENQLFPILESHGLSGPPQVMWAIHDEVRASIKDAIANVEGGAVHEAVTAISTLSEAVKDMVYKEEHILFPMCLDSFSEAEWVRVRTGEEDVGYAWVEPSVGWEPDVGEVAPDTRATAGPGAVGERELELELDTGRMTPEQVNLMLKHMPVDMTFVNDRDEVAYFSATEHRIFPRSPGIIGRQVSKCHPPKSVHSVERIVAAFKSGERDVAEFWLELSGRLIHIRYLAVRDDDGNYRGTLEFSQDLTELREIEGEQRLLDWK